MIGKISHNNKFLLVAFRAILLLLCNLGSHHVLAEQQAFGIVEKGQLKIKGEWIQGGLLSGQVEPGSKVTFLGNEVVVSTEGNFILGIGRDAPQSLEVLVESGESQETFSFPVIQRDYAIQRIEGVESKYVSPPEEVLQRIRNDGVSVTRARKLRDVRADFNGGFIWPSKGPISGVYGSQRVFNGVPKRPHYGVDVAAPVGTPVVAPAAGKITLAKDLYYSGWTVVLDHGQGLSSSFLHLNKALVKEGDYVEQGQLIAEIGATGRVTGAHLDWRMNWMNQRIDPQRLVVPMETVAPDKGK